MNVRRFIFLLSLSCLCALSCKSEYEMLLKSNDVDAKYKAAMEYYNKGRFNKAAGLFESLTVLTGGTDKDDTVQFYLGKSNYNNRDYYTAETNFAKYVEIYPASTFTPEATFLRLECLYRQTLRYELDQNPTRKAIAAMNEYVSEYKDKDENKERLDRCWEMLDDLHWSLYTKEYEAARLYYNMEDYIASRVAFRNILKENAENCHREDILYYIAMSSYKYARLSIDQKQKERYLSFQDDYYNFIGEYPISKYRREMDAVYRRSQKALGRYVSEVEDDNVSESELEKQRKFEERKQAIENRKKENAVREAEMKAARAAKKAAKKAEKEARKAARKAKKASKKASRQIEKELNEAQKRAARDTRDAENRALRWAERDKKDRL